MSKNHGSIIVLVSAGFAPVLINMNCSDDQNYEDKLLMLMNVVPVNSGIIQNKVLCNSVWSTYWEHVVLNAEELPLSWIGMLMGKLFKGIIDHIQYNDQPVRCESAQ